MQNSESVQENETHKVLGEFEIQTDHLISARRPVIVNKKSEKKDKYQDLVRELKKNKQTMEHESDIDINCIWRGWYSHQRTETGTRGHENKRTSEDDPITSLLKSDRILRNVLETSDLSLKLQWETIT